MRRVPRLPCWSGWARPTPPSTSRGCACARLPTCLRFAKGVLCRRESLAIRDGTGNFRESQILTDHAHRHLPGQKERAGQQKKPKAVPTKTWSSKRPRRGRRGTANGPRAIGRAGRLQLRSTISCTWIRIQIFIVSGVSRPITLLGKQTNCLISGQFTLDSLQRQFCRMPLLLMVQAVRLLRPALHTFVVPTV